VDGYERVPVFAHKLRWGMKAQKKSRQKEKAIPERGLKKGL